MTDFENRQQAEKAVRANLSPRAIRLDMLERWSLGRQYEGRCSFWGSGNDGDPPLWERAPCIVYPIVAIAIQSNVDLVLGEGRFPSFSARPSEDDAAQESGTSNEAAQAIDRWITEHHRLSKFRAHARSAFSAAQACGTAVAIHGARNGLPFADLIPAKWCQPTLGTHGEVLELEIKYPYLEEYQRDDGKWALRAKLYRRVINDRSDTTFQSADASEDGRQNIAWKTDPNQSIDHNLGFCPAIWYQFMRGCMPINVIDGHAIHEQLTDEIEAHDMALSERHRCALLSEPQPCEIGVAPGTNPTAPGRLPYIPGTERGGPEAHMGGDPGESRGGYIHGSGPAQGARKKGPGYVWQYADPETKVQYLTFPDSVLKGLDEHARDLRIKLQEALAIVGIDIEHMRLGQFSGRALETIKQRQIDRCDQFRDDLRDNFFLPSIDMQLRIAAKLGASLRVSNTAQIAQQLQKFVRDGGLSGPAKRAA